MLQRSKKRWFPLQVHPFLFRFPHTVRTHNTYNIILVIPSVSTLLLQAWGFWAKRTQMLRILDKLRSGICCTFVKVQAFCELVPVNRAQIANESKRGNIPRGKFHIIEWWFLLQAKFPTARVSHNTDEGNHLLGPGSRPMTKSRHCLRLFLKYF